MQGQLRQQSLTVTIQTSCGHCSRPMELTVGSNMAINVSGDAAGALVFLPQVDWENFAVHTIIDAY